ncbi:hypothetical protein BJ138DRAFT_998204 [Hygrophoropsis aurantiaca]|uniref:Uncharacterized protein n=1 Tax=Hygrophoropsis aurantiaca TaxID=72124 RepID=A0ACB8AQ27_9AGAM|nr:hypothetical protein BJ138DRAFT_998204 [Hygrophoropsis aurantiaca]
MSRTAKATLVASFAVSSLIIWGVHYQQNKERSDMFQGVLRDDVRRKEKMRQREEAFIASSRKREMYERVQSVVPSNNTDET